ncbi:hypothetical protein H2O03_32915 [Pseudomonas aeruginosa]|uniref:hypothetical protein n=1 Tax=Pseudomonas aeruginosa TaxID=287 RepID=UPI0015EFF500|nr:hypothetical protein [Pseudomonas aeruginosa]MBA4953740.1 hypothetical protein [Pseudomonas aeruginosa]
MYVIACGIVAGLAAAVALLGFTPMMEALAAGERRKAFAQWARTMLLVLLPVVLMCAPIGSSIYDAVQADAGKPIAFHNGRITVVMALFGSLAVVLIAAARAVVNRKHASFWFVGWAMASVLAGGVGAIASAKQLAFLDEHSGMVAFGFFRDQVKDMHCDADVILARWDEKANSPVAYRCPKVYLLNRFASAPFVPWPDYTEGESEDLGRALAAALRDAKR